MCSTCDCDKNPPVDGKPNSSGLKPCRRCGSVSFIVLDKVHFECRDCFLESCNKKIRSTIGRSKMLKNNDPILIAYSGGQSSTALLSLIKKSMEYDARREQKFRPSILHIDIQSIFNLTSQVQEDQRADKLKIILQSLSDLYPDWPIYWTTLEMFHLEDESRSIFSRYDCKMSSEDFKLEHLLNERGARETLQTQLASKCDLTAKHQYVQESTASLIYRVASTINDSISTTEDHFKFVFTAGSATQLANNLLVDVIMGKGATIRSTVSVCDQRLPVPILRPMRDFSKKEIAFYLKARQTECHIQPNLLTFADRKSSIQTVTEAFLSKLYIDYPSTYNTLLRTGNKMQ